MRRVVYDANVWFSSLVFPGPVPRAVVDLCRMDQVKALSSEPIIDQVLRALAGLGWSRVDIRDAELNIRQLFDIVAPKLKLDVIVTKPSDNRVLECAVAGQADFIVSGDRKHLLRLGNYEGIPIVSPREFLRLFTQGFSSSGD